MKQHDLTEQDKIFHSDGYKLAQQVINPKITQDSLFNAIKVLYETIDGLNTSIEEYAKQQGIQIDCRSGCEYCCHQAIYAATHEFEYLIDYIADNSDKLNYKEIYKSAKSKDEIVRELPQEDMLEYTSPCPLLEDGKCSAYEARPMACRIYLSTDVKTCKAKFDKTEKEGEFPALLDFPLRAGRMLNEGFIAGLKTGGWNSKEHRIEEGLRYHMLLHPDLVNIEK